jgi:hypothetical protein
MNQREREREREREKDSARVCMCARGRTVAREGRKRGKKGAEWLNDKKIKKCSEGSSR